MMNSLIKLLIFLFWCCCTNASSLWAWQLGTGVSSITAGRLHPLAFAAVEIGTWSVSFAGLGFRHQFGQTLAYATTCQYQFSVNAFAAGIGIGANWLEVSYQGLGIAQPAFGHTWSVGPAIKVFYYPARFWWAGMQGIFGLDLATLTGLATQDQVMALTGVDF